MSRQVEVLPGRHLVASSGGVVVLVAHRDEGAVTADSVAARAMTALLGIVRQATSNEPRRSGRTVARLATNWLMGLENGDEDAVEFGVITPGDGGVAVFLHGGVTAVLSGVERSEILRGREAGFTVDRVVTPAPGVGVGLFVDEVGEVAERLPERGVFALWEGTAPGGGVVLWFGAGGLATGAGGFATGAGGLVTGAEGVPLRGVEPEIGGHPQRGFEQHHGVAQPHGAQPQFGVQARSGFEKQHGVRQQHSAETPTGGQAPHGREDQRGAGQRHDAEPLKDELPGGEPPQAPDLWKRDDIADAGTEYYSTSPVSREPEASGSTGVEQQYGVAPQQVPDLRKRDDLADAGTEYYGTSPVPRELAASESPGVEQRHDVARQQVSDLRQRDGIADAGTEYYGTSPVSREPDPAGRTGAEQQYGVAPHQVPGLRKRDDIADAGTEYYSTSPVSPAPTGRTGAQEERGLAPQQAPDLRKRDDNADAATEQYGASGVSRESDAAGSAGGEPPRYGSESAQQAPPSDARYGSESAHPPRSNTPHSSGAAGSASGELPVEIAGASPSFMTPPRTQIPLAGGVAESQSESTSSARPVLRGPHVPPADAVAEQSSGSSPSVSPAQPHDRVMPPSTPRLSKPVSTGQPESVAHSGAQPGIARPDSVAAQPLPNHPAVRDVDLEETVVPGETLAPRVRDGGVVAESRGVVVKGFKCARDHLNDPRVSFCAVCGIRMDQLTCILTDGIRPPLGLLLFDDGTSFVLDNDCVLGREPEHAEAVARGARPVRVEDHSGGMSRAHAEIRLVDWDVTVVDGGSTNGTHIRQPGHQDWTRAIPGHPVKLTPGAQIQLGGRVATFDSQHGQL
ncbi:FHA domain-containing protein [Nocardia suismassiliense]|uniref:FHA domain-containing protein n=1 Tax=Nocardia suismassiliense TaxID=2077092 RepID=A0ABW6QXK9_9NOCA